MRSAFWTDLYHELMRLSWPRLGVLFAFCFLAFNLTYAPPARADAPSLPAVTLQHQVDTALAAAPKGTRFGLLVVDAAGTVIVAVGPDQRFIPASNTKLFTTAAAYALLPGMDQSDAAGGTQVALVPLAGAARFARTGSGALPGLGPADKVPAGPADVWLSGRGDARMSSAADCTADCLAALADAVAAKTNRVHDVVGDDSFWPDQRWPPGMSWNNIGTDDGTAASALNLNDNQLVVTVTPGAERQPPAVVVSAYFTLRNDARTVAPGNPTSLMIERSVNGLELRLSGSIPADAGPWTERIGIDDPAHFAGWTFRNMLAARGVKVTGKVRVNHRAKQLDDLPHDQGPLGNLVQLSFKPLATLTPPQHSADVVVINKFSQNLHAQVLFRRVGDSYGTGSEEWSVAAFNTLFAKAGIPREGYDFSDGSGMSTYNRVSPRAVVALLRWAAAQPWGGAWLASLPIAGVDGTLKRRFVGTPLAGNLAAKTGSLNATTAISGTFRAASGRQLTFAFLANDVPNGQSAVAVMDAVLLLVAANN